MVGKGEEEQTKKEKICLGIKFARALVFISYISVL